MCWMAELIHATGNACAVAGSNFIRASRSIGFRCRPNRSPGFIAIARAVYCHMPACGCPRCSTPSECCIWTRICSSGAISADPQVDLQAPYFNTGVLLMDLRGWRRERIEDRALEELRAAPQQFRFWDQTVLNPLLRGRVQWLPDFWTRFVWQADRAGFDDLRCILHFAAWTPWIEYAYSDGHRLYHRFMRISGFDREWRARGWRRSRIKRRLLLALAPWLPAYYRARARVCVRQGHADQARLFEQAASDWVREGRRYREARCNRRWNRTQIDRYLRDLRSLIRAREGEA